MSNASWARMYSGTAYVMMGDDPEHKGQFRIAIKPDKSNENYTHLNEKDIKEIITAMQAWLGKMADEKTETKK